MASQTPSKPKNASTDQVASEVEVAGVNKQADASDNADGTQKMEVDGQENEVQDVKMSEGNEDAQQVNKLEVDEGGGAGGGAEKSKQEDAMEEDVDSEDDSEEVIRQRDLLLAVADGWIPDHLRAEAEAEAEAAVEDVEEDESGRYISLMVNVASNRQQGKESLSTKDWDGRRNRYQTRRLRTLGLYGIS